MIKSGRYGTIKYDPLGVTPAPVISLNKWQLSLKTDKINVTCFGDLNKVYVPGLKDISGSVSGFWNSADLTLVRAADATTPGLIELAPNSTEATFKFFGLAYLDASIDTSVEGAPALSGQILAAGPWTLPA